MPGQINAAAERNKGAILDVLNRYLPSSGDVLEIASGTGQHVAHFAAAHPKLSWQPSDATDELFDSIAAHVAGAGVDNVLPPLVLDVTRPDWPVARADVVVCINMIHISPWETTPALFAGAARVLPPDGVVFLYGPYKRGNVHTAPSNEAFDASLRARNPAWGLRDMEAVIETAAAAGFAHEDVIAMPANNFSVIFSRSA
ncbi:MAG TPA: DUF938 domain-containing protein [Gammaproteobacteria bacterium]